MKVKPLVAGNWKMNGLTSSVSQVRAVAEALAGPLNGLDVDVMIAPPAPLIAFLADTASDTSVELAGQDCHAAASGAHTGDIAAEMLKDAGASAVIVGHSERRADHGETSVMVQSKALAGHRAGLTAIVCIGETEAERKAGQTLDVVSQQLKESLPDACTALDTVIAYEPVWAIGTGLTPTPQDVAEVHGAIRRQLVARFGSEGGLMRIIYGGSVKPGNAAELMAVAEVNGALVGGASLKADDFVAIIQAYESLL